jgi:nucleoside 2-deoxyribosyltransferase
MFSDADKWQQALIAETLEQAGFSTYLPQRDGLEVGQLMKLVNKPLMEATAGSKLMLLLRQAVFALDCYQLLERCHSVVFNMDGRVPDDGSVVEASAAFAAGQPIVIFKTTPITILDGTDNPMVTGLSTVWSYVSSVEAIAPALVQACDRVAAAGPYTYAPPPHLRDVLAVGADVWRFLEDFRAHNPEAELRDIVEALAEWVSGHHGLRALLDRVLAHAHL